VTAIATRLAHPYRSAGLMSTTSVPSIASMGPMRMRRPSMARTVTGWRPSGFGRSGDRVANTPVSRRRLSPRGRTRRTFRRSR
jgi:hypothetical protein